MSEDFERRYPINRTRYTQAVGKLLAHRISQVFKDLGFETRLNCGQSNGVDLEVYYKNLRILAAEVLNWSIGSFLSNKRKNWIIRNLTSYKGCYKVLIYTVFKNEYVLEDFQNHEISLIRIGYQLLPKEFYRFYAKKKQTKSRKIDSKKTRELIKSRIVKYLTKTFVHKKSKTEIVFSNLFQNAKSVFLSISPKNKHLMGKLRRKLESCLFFSLFSETKNIEPIKTKKSILFTSDYIHVFSITFFHSLISLKELMSSMRILIDQIPNTLYHGTTTKFLPEIIKEGLLPIKAGKCWKDVNDQQVYLTDSLFAAEFFALKATKKFGGEPVILLINVKGLKEKFKVGIERFDKETPSAFDIYKEFSIEEPISPKRIKDWYIFREHQSLFILLNQIQSFYKTLSDLEQLIQGLHYHSPKN